MTAKEYLKQIKKIDTQMRNKGVEAKQLNGINTSLAGSVCMEIERLYRERASIIKTIELLPEAEYDVLHKVYVQYATLQEVATDRGISYSLTATIHGRALKRLQDLINSKE